MNVRQATNILVKICVKYHTEHILKLSVAFLKFKLKWEVHTLSLAILVLRKLMEEFANICGNLSLSTGLSHHLLQ